MPETSIDGWRWKLAEPLLREATTLREIEKYCDMAHFSIEHDGTCGDTEHPEAGSYRVVTPSD